MGNGTAADIFQSTGMLQTDGHFLVPVSGRHSRTRINKHVIHKDRGAMFALARMIAEEFAALKIDGVVGLMKGGKILADWAADSLTIATSTKVESFAAIKRGDGKAFYLDEPTRNVVRDKRLLLMDDIVATGESIRRAIDAVHDARGEIMGVGVLFNQCEFSTVNLADVAKFFALAHVTLDSWPAPACPLCREGAIPLQEA